MLGTLGLSIHLRGYDGPTSELLMGDYATARFAMDWRRQYRRFVLSDCGLAVRNPHEALIHKG